MHNRFATPMAPWFAEDNPDEDPKNPDHDKGDRGGEPKPKVRG